MKLFSTLCIILSGLKIVTAQRSTSTIPWIQPADEKAPPIWGLRNGIVIGLWPASIEKGDAGGMLGGLKGLLRIGYEYMGAVYLVDFIVVEPVVENEMKFSEVSQSIVDGKLGKILRRR